MNYLVQDICRVSAPAVIVHGVNCQGVMQSGVAKALYQRWPEVKNEYLQFSHRQLGRIAPVQVADALYVVNAFTQQDFGYDGAIYADVDAVALCLENVGCFCRSQQIRQIYAPRIACGRGGLDWAREVEPLFARFVQAHPYLNVTICDLN